MNDNEFIHIGMILISTIFGFAVGAIACIIMTVKENKALKKEVDKFRDLYFQEMDKWRNKYNDDDYEAY
jgi:hypothetical protein